MMNVILCIDRVKACSFETKRGFASTKKGLIERSGKDEINNGTNSNKPSIEKSVLSKKKC